MKIKKLYTLSQFIDYLESFTEKEIIKILGLDQRCMSYEIESQLYNFVLSYNNFLKQPLRKEMFINEIEKPKISAYQNLDGTNDISQFDNDFEEWQKVEKKVISDEVKLINKVLIWKSFEYKVLGGHFKSWDEIEQHMTLEDLAEKTNGQLKLKNVEL
jgi:hypothetical protein